MKIIFKDKKAEQQFSSKYRSKWRYPEQVKIKLLAAENFIVEASSLQDIANYPPFHFHSLQGDRKGEWGIYLGKKLGYRISVIPCDDEGNKIVKGDIIAQCKQIKVVLIMEVSNHYE